MSGKISKPATTTTTATANDNSNRQTQDMKTEDGNPASLDKWKSAFEAGAGVGGHLVGG